MYYILQNQGLDHFDKEIQQHHQNLLLQFPTEPNSPITQSNTPAATSASKPKLTVNKASDTLKSDEKSTSKTQSKKSTEAIKIDNIVKSTLNEVIDDVEEKEGKEGKEEVEEEITEEQINQLHEMLDKENKNKNDKLDFIRIITKYNVLKLNKADAAGSRDGS